MKSKNKKGFTVIEIVIAISISILLFFVLMQSYDLSQKIYRTTDAKAELSQNGRVILDRLIRELRQTPYIITELPETAGATSTNEIIFQDGHNISEINYIRYYLDGQNLNRQDIYYYFPDTTSTHVYYNTVGQSSTLPTVVLSNPKIIGEYVDGIEFWGNGLININLYLSKNGQTEIMNTAVYGRNL